VTVTVAVVVAVEPLDPPQAVVAHTAARVTTLNHPVGRSRPMAGTVLVYRTDHRTDVVLSARWDQIPVRDPFIVMSMLPAESTAQLLPLALRAVVASRARCDPPPLVALRRADVDDRRELAVVPGENPPNQDRAAFLAAVIDERAESVTVPERVNVPLPSPPRTESDAGVLPVR
jgi:hypothetical protein